jgi:EmrB/QacA subfamily drug resistance transporter
MEPARRPPDPAGRDDASRTGGADKVRGLRRWLSVEPARPRAIASRPTAHWWTVATVCVGAFMGQLDASVVSLAFPTLKHDFHATLGAVQWVGLSYLLVLVALVPAVGRYADMVGRKLLYTYGFVVFIVGSALCGLAPSLPLLDGFRALQGLGAAMLQANSVAIIALAVPRERLGRAIGIQGAAQALGLSLGPAVGGLLIAAGGWRLIFWINVPAGIVGTIAGWYLIPRSRELQQRVRFDWSGLALFVPVLSALLLALSYGNELGWSSDVVLVSLVVAVLLGVAFVRAERRASAPMIDPGLFSRIAFSAGIASGLLSYLVLFGSLFVTPFFLEVDRGLSPGATGTLLTALPVALGLVAPLAGRAADTLGARRLTVAGMLISAAALTLLALQRGATSSIALELALLGVGLGLFTPANNAAIMGAAPRAQAGSASGVLNMTRGLGTSLGLSLTGLVFAAVAGTQARPDLVASGFTAAALFLAGAAFVAALLASLRGASPLDAAAARVDL